MDILTGSNGFKWTQKQTLYGLTASPLSSSKSSRKPKGHAVSHVVTASSQNVYRTRNKSIFHHRLHGEQCNARFIHTWWNLEFQNCVIMMVYRIQTGQRSLTDSGMGSVSDVTWLLVATVRNANVTLLTSLVTSCTMA